MPDEKKYKKCEKQTMVFANDPKFSLNGNRFIFVILFRTLYISLT